VCIEKGPQESAVHKIDSVVPTLPMVNVLNCFLMQHPDPRIQAEARGFWCARCDQHRRVDYA